MKIVMINGSPRHGNVYAAINALREGAEGENTVEILEAYIHYNKKQNTYSWSEQSQGFYMLPERFQWIKDNGLKDELDALYIRKKNNNDDPNKHSRSLFAEAVNDCYNENCDE